MILPHSQKNGDGLAWVDVSADFPCPVCGKHGWCSYAANERDEVSAVYCGRPDQNQSPNVWFLKKSTPNGIGKYLFTLHGSGAESAPIIAPPVAKRKKKPTWSYTPEKLAGMVEVLEANLPEEWLIWKAEVLGVTPQSLKDIHVGWGDEPTWRRLNIQVAGMCFSFPERNAEGNFTTIIKRHDSWDANGKSKDKQLSIYNGTRAFTYADDWKAGDGPILCVEGASDAAAVLSMGHRGVIGRPGSQATPAEGAKLLQQVDDRRILVFGDCDKKTDDKGHTRDPGKSAAINWAQQVATALERPVELALPPDGFNDLRTWLTDRGKELDNPFQTLISSVCVEQIEPETIAKPEPYRPPQGDIVNLGPWRKQMEKNRQAIIGRPGFYFDGSATGAGKDFTDRTVQEQVEKSLTVQPNHVNTAAKAQDMRDCGLDAAAFPRMDETTCDNLDEANRALSFGLSPQATVCMGCDKRETCQYQKDFKIAKEAMHQVATTHRGAIQLPTLAKGKDYVSIHEDASDIIAPTKVVDPQDFVPWLVVLAHAMATESKRAIRDERKSDGGHMVYQVKGADGEFVTVVLYQFLAAMYDFAEDVRNSLDTVEVTKAVTMPCPMRPPKQLQRKLYEAIRYTECNKSKLNGDAGRLLCDVVSGKVKQLVFQVTHSHAVKDTQSAKRGDRIKNVVLVATNHSELPTDAPVIFQDATSSAKRIGDLARQTITDITPKGRLPRMTPIKQVPVDITKRQKVENAEAWLRGTMAQYADRTRIGVIGHKKHIEAMLEGFTKRDGSKIPPTLDEQTRARICKWSHWGKGDERASNDWLECDLIIIVGTPRVNSNVLGQRLITAGKITAAADPEQGSFGEVQWTGMTQSRMERPVTHRMPTDPDWREEYETQTIAHLLQAVGRGRAVLGSDGVEVVAITTAPLPSESGAHLAELGEIRELSRATIEVVEAIKAAVGSCASAIGITKAGAQLPPGDGAALGAHTSEIAKRLICHKKPREGQVGVHKGTASRRLQRAVDEGAVIKRGELWCIAPSHDHLVIEGTVPRPAKGPANTLEIAERIPGVTTGARFAGAGGRVPAVDSIQPAEVLSGSDRSPPMRD